MEDVNVGQTEGAVENQEEAVEQPSLSESLSSVEAPSEEDLFSVVPESCDGYELTGYEVEEGSEAFEAYKEFALQHNLTRGQFQAFVDFAYQDAEAVREAREAEEKDNLQNLRKEWGSKWESNLALVDKAGQFLGGEIVEFLQKSGAIKQPTVLKALAKIGHQFAEDGINTPSDAAPTSKDEVLQMMKDPRYQNPGMDGGKYKAEVNNLYSKTLNR